MRLRTYYLTLTIATIAAVPLFFATRSIGFVLTQVRKSDDRQINKFDYGAEPVEVVAVKTAKREIVLGKTFERKEDWLKDFSITFKNISDKSIKYFKIALDFPETKSTGSVLRFPLEYGNRSKFGVRASYDKRVQPGESFELMLSDEKFNSLKSIIGRRQELDSLTKIDLFIEFVLFDDGMAWSGGYFMQPDSKNPNSFYPIGVDRSKFIPLKKHD